MAKINNTQNIHVSGSKNVRLSGISNTVTNEEALSGADEIEKAFAAILLAVSRLPKGSDHTEAEQAVQALAGEARKGEEAREKSVSKWMKFLLETAPDVFEVAAETFLSPIKGLSLVFQKVAKRMVSIRR